LKAAGIRREERVLLLMLDSSDWPVSFLGCLYAGIVPVAVNTLLTPDDYAYMLDHSARAGRAGVGRAAAAAAAGDGARRP
jgi:acyl-CoA synthetase (AMP-forming)/AMP-acid ligase II